MNRQDAKDILPIIQAFAEGKTILYRLFSAKHWIESTAPSFNIEEYEYRIKPESKYRPFANAEECWEEMQKHLPFGWVKYKDKDSYTAYWNVNNNCDFESDFNDYVFVDGEPFGIMED